MTLDDLYTWLESVEGGVRSVRSPEAIHDLIIDLRAVVARCNPEAEEELRALQIDHESLQDKLSDLADELDEVRNTHADHETKLIDEIQNLEGQLVEIRNDLKRLEENGLNATP